MMKSKIVFAFFIMFFLCRGAAGFEASVSRTVIPEGESFQLYLRQDGNGAQPDISVLNEDFLITMERKSFKSTYVNGKAQSFNENVLTLIPKKTGKIVLPSIHAGKEKTSPIALTVVAGGQVLPDDPVARQKAQAVQPNVFIRYALEDKTPYVGQQIPLTVRLFSFVKTPLLDGSVVPPKADGVTSEQWGDAKRRREVVNDRAYDVWEYRFLLFAQKSGKIRLSPAQFRGTVSDPDGRREETDDLFGMGGGFFSGFFNQKNIAVQSDPIVLDVRPAQADANYWLPATEVAVSEDLTPSKQSIALGEAVTRTVTVMASGVRDSQIPDPVFADGSDYKQYPGKTDSKNLFDDNGVIGVKTRQIVFMPTVAGKVVLPSMEIPWFDVKTGKMKKALLPSRSITVTGEAVENVAPLPQKPEPVQNIVAEREAPPVERKESVFAEAFSEPVESPEERQAVLSFWEKYVRYSPLRLFLAGIFVGVAVVGSLWLLFYRMVFGRAKKEAGSVPPKENDSGAIKRLREACHAGKADEARQALLEWARLHWPEKPPLTVSELAARLNSPALVEEAGSLNKALYGGNLNEWHGENLWRTFKAAQTDERKRTENEKIPVPPLYPD